MYILTLIILISNFETNIEFKSIVIPDFRTEARCIAYGDTVSNMIAPKDGIISTSFVCARAY